MPPRVHILSLDIYREAQDAPEHWCLTAADTESTHAADTGTDSTSPPPRGPGTERYAAPISRLNTAVQLKRTPMFVGVCATSKMCCKITKVNLKAPFKMHNKELIPVQVDLFKSWSLTEPDDVIRLSQTRTSNKFSSFQQVVNAMHDLSLTAHRVSMRELTN